MIVTNMVVICDDCGHEDAWEFATGSKYNVHAGDYIGKCDCGGRLRVYFVSESLEM